MVSVLNCFCSIDGTKSQGAGRMVNDNWTNPNCKVKVLSPETPSSDQPRLGFFALKSIAADEQLSFDYGDKSLPWRKVSTYLFKKVIISG